jgi:hypothetical protein
MSGCTALKSLTLGLKNIKSSGIFQHCSLLTDIYLTANQVVTLSDVGLFSFIPTGCNVHVRSEYADQYASATNWSSLIANGKIVIVGDYSD